MKTLSQYIGNLLKKTRKDKKISVAVIAKRMNKSVSYYYGLENATVPLNELNIRRAYDALGISYDPNRYTPQIGYIK